MRGSQHLQALTPAAGPACFYTRDSRRASVAASLSFESVGGSPALS